MVEEKLRGGEERLEKVLLAAETQNANKREEMVSTISWWTMYSEST